MKNTGEPNTVPDETVSCWALSMNAQLAPVFDWCINNVGVNRLLLSTRLNTDFSVPTPNRPEAVEITESLFGDRIIAKRLASAWPGTELIGHQGLVFEVEFDASLVPEMVRVAPRFPDWTQWNSPALPEDLCLFRAGSRWPALVTVTHENDGWILSSSKVTLEGVQKSHLTPTEVLIPDPPCFCKE